MGITDVETGGKNGRMENETDQIEESKEEEGKMRETGVNAATG